MGSHVNENEKKIVKIVKPKIEQEVQRYDVSLGKMAGNDRIKLDNIEMYM